MIFRKKKTIDGMDREILRRINNSKRALTSRQIAREVNLSGSAIIPRLQNLKAQGILKDNPTGMRKFERTFDKKTVKIKAPRSIFWELDIGKQLKKEKKKFFGG
jgi:DNA-binding Lrp family transcriptional regulator